MTRLKAEKRNVAVKLEQDPNGGVLITVGKLPTLALSWKMLEEFVANAHFWPDNLWTDLHANASGKKPKAAYREAWKALDKIKADRKKNEAAYKKSQVAK